MKLSYSKLSIPALIVAMVSAAAVTGCTDSQSQQAQAVIAGLCAGAQAGAVLVAADGSIVGASTKLQTNIATGQKLVAVSCSSIGPAIASVTAAMKNANATALVTVENDQASSLHISPALMHKIVGKYAHVAGLNTP